MKRMTTSTLRQARRRGISMIETLVLVTCMGVVLGLAATTIQLMLRLYSDGQARLSSSLVLERLARQLRADAHLSATAELEATQGKPAGEHTVLKLSPELNREVIYKVLEKSIDRDEAMAGKRVRHESFALERGRRARFERGEEAGRQAVSLVIEPLAGSRAAGSQRALEVLAVVGKHRASPIAKKEGEKP
jgi:type II secretory pathway pseudopilin PulG